jgi:IS5 family transposase
MDSFNSYLLRKLYKETTRDGDKLAEAEKQIDWNRFTPIIQPMYNNQGPTGGRPNMDPVLMVKLLVLQAWYGLSDPELERQVNDRLSFRHFLGYPERAPDYSTVWSFRERLARTGKDKEIWAELQRQLDTKGLKVRKGVVQDASFITSDPGHAAAEKPRGEKARTRRSKDGA